MSLLPLRQPHVRILRLPQHLLWRSTWMATPNKPLFQDFFYFVNDRPKLNCFKKIIIFAFFSWLFGDSDIFIVIGVRHWNESFRLLRFKNKNIFGSVYSCITVFMYLCISLDYCITVSLYNCITDSCSDTVIQWYSNTVIQ